LRRSNISIQEEAKGLHQKQTPGERAGERAWKGILNDWPRQADTRREYGENHFETATKASEKQNNSRKEGYSMCQRLWVDIAKYI
jgi:hypothetical protein